MVKVQNNSRLYIGLPDGTHILECDVLSIDFVKNRFRFTVINGLWEGYFDINQSIIRVDRTRETYPAQVIHVGSIAGEDYNERINKVQYKGPIKITIGTSKPRPFRTQKGKS